MKVRVILLGLAIAFSGTPALCCVDPTISDCEKLYNEARFSDADVTLNKVLRRTPADASVHYLLGNVLIKQGKAEEALHQYKVAEELSRDPVVSKYCKAAIARLSGQAAPSQNTSAQPTAGAIETNAHQALRRSVEDVSRETGSVSDSTSIECGVRLKEVTDDYNRQLSQLEKDMKERIEPLEDPNNPTNNPQNRRYNDGAMLEFIKIRKEWDTKRSQLEQQKQRELAEVQRFFDDRRQALEEYATNIDRAYAHGGEATSIKLAPLGTNLYMKNYQTMAEPSGSLMPLRAVPELLLPQK